MKAPAAKPPFPHSGVAKKKLTSRYVQYSFVQFLLCALLFEKIQLFADDVLMRGEPKEMMLLVIMSTPAVVIDGRVMCAGRVPSGQEVREWIAGGADGGR